MRDALVHIVLRLREDALRDRDETVNSSRDNMSSKPALPSVDMLYPSSGLPLSSGVPSAPHINYDRRTTLDVDRGLGIYPSTGLYGYSSLPVRTFHVNIITETANRLVVFIWALIISVAGQVLVQGHCSVQAISALIQSPLPLGFFFKDCSHTGYNYSGFSAGPFSKKTYLIVIFVCFFLFGIPGWVSFEEVVEFLLVRFWS